MRIKTLHVQRYGPFGGFGPHDLPRFSLVYGPNERGKTLLIDAILRMLFKNKLGRSVKYFGNLHRVEEQPEGYLVLDVNGEEIKLERGETLDKYINISPADFRNIFVVRDSELGVHDPGEHYARISERLAGLETTRIQKIKRALQKRGRLTNPGSGAGLADNAETEHIKRRVIAAAECIDEIDSLYDALSNESFDTLDRSLVDAEAALDEAKTELDLMRRAKTHRRFESARERLEAIGDVDGKLERAGRLTREDLDSWKQAERDRARLDAELKEIADERKRLRDDLTRMEEKRAVLRQESAALDDAIGVFDERIAPVLDEYEERSRKSAADAPRRKTWARVALACSVMFVGALVAAIADSKAFYGPIAAALFVLALVGGWRVVAGAGIISKLAEAAETIRLLAVRAGIDEGTPQSARRYRAALDEKRTAARSELDGVTEKCIELEKRDELNVNRAGKVRDDVAECGRVIDEVRHRSGMESVDDMVRAIEDKTALAAKRQSLAAVLDELTGAGNARNGRTDTDRWRGVIAAYFESVPDGADTLDYNEARERALVDEVASLEEKTVSLRGKLETGKDALRDLERRIQESKPFDVENMACRTVDDLVRTRGALKNFVDEIGREKDAALLALSVFEEIEAEEKSKVLDLFGPESNVSDHFRRITRGRYTDVLFDLETAGIDVVGSDGDKVNADHLSGGALDQLHFAVRLSIGERMFPDGRGLLILDDPFIKSDGERLGIQMALLREVVSAGWQVVYFSAKDEVKAALMPDIASGSVGVFEVGRLRSETPKPA